LHYFFGKTFSDKPVIGVAFGKKGMKDIMINLSWKFSKRNLTQIIMHEILHVMGFTHQEFPPTVMFPAMFHLGKFDSGYYHNLPADQEKRYLKKLNFHKKYSYFSELQAKLAQEEALCENTF